MVKVKNNSYILKIDGRTDGHSHRPQLYCNSNRYLFSTAISGYPTGYSVICRITGQRQISGKKGSGSTLIFIGTAGANGRQENSNHHQQQVNG